MGKKVAVVTGGTGGIGSAICQNLSRDYQVIACYYKEGNHEQAKHWQRVQKDLGYAIDILYADVSKFEDCEQLVALVLERYEHIDVLVNNAGITMDTCLRKMDTNQWQRVIDSNLTSVFNMTRHILPAMIAQNYGRIITISSVNGRKGQFGQCNYSAAKAGILGFTKSLALEVASKGITVNSISPGYIATSMLSELKEDILQQIIQQIPLGRLGKPEEVASAVAYLASSEAGFINGANIDINGGQYM